MKFDKILQLFVVKEKRFFPLFIKSAENILEAAKLFQEQTKAEDADQRRMLSHKIKEHETAGDAITQKIISELLDAYVTPFDRDDIHALAEIMDTFLDNIRDASKKIAIYQPKVSSRKVIEIADYIVKDAELILEATKMFQDITDKIDEIDKLCAKVKEIEHAVDDIYETYMINLFEKEPDPVELIKKANIIQAIEDTSDVAKSVARAIRSILVKMS